MAQAHRFRESTWPLMSQEEESPPGPQKMWGALGTSTKHRCLRALGGYEHRGASDTTVVLQHFLEDVPQNSWPRGAS